MGQSSTDSRTLPSTRRSPSATSSRCARSLSRSISRCIHDSRTSAEAARPEPSPDRRCRRRHPARAPRARRRRRGAPAAAGARRGGPSAPCAASSALTESTRNGMSSVTICDDGVAAGPALLLDLGVEHLDLGRADGRGPGRARGGPAPRPAGPRAPAPGGPRWRRAGSRSAGTASTASPPAVVRALRGGVQELLTGLLQRRRHGCRLHPHVVTLVVSTR